MCLSKWRCATGASIWTPVRPTPRALELFQDRLLEKQFLQEVGIPTPAFAPVDLDNPEGALEQVGCPCVVKARLRGLRRQGSGGGAYARRVPARCRAAG
jgi:phosphoribosylaminoimidazole carboxylase (NCAIR synthetase)